MKINILCNLVLVQPLNFVLNKIFQDEIQRLGLKQRSMALQSRCNEHSQWTCFKAINTNINHSWIDPCMIIADYSKLDKLPIPIRMWDDRARLAFPGHNGFDNLIKNLWTLWLRCYRLSLLTSLTWHLEQTFPSKWKHHELGKRHVVRRRGGGRKYF